MRGEAKGWCGFDPDGFGGVRGLEGTPRGSWRPAVAALGQIVRADCSRRPARPDPGRVCEAVG